MNDNKKNRQINNNDNKQNCDLSIYMEGGSLK